MEPPASPSYPPRGGTSRATPRSGKLAAKKGNGGGTDGIFADPEGSTAYLSAEAAAIRRMLMANDEGLRAGLEELDADIDSSVHERKDMLNKVQAEFNTFVHRKKEKVTQEIEEFAQEQLLGDTNREKVLDDLVKNMEQIRYRLVDVGLTWGKACSNMGHGTLAELDHTRRRPLGPAVDADGSAATMEAKANAEA
jgi:hypothetical protein